VEVIISVDGKMNVPPENKKVPLERDGKPMTENATRRANLYASNASKPEPYTEAQIVEAMRRDSVGDPFENIFENNTDYHRKSVEEQSENIFENETGSGSHQAPIDDEFYRIFERPLEEKTGALLDSKSEKEKIAGSDDIPPTVVKNLEKEDSVSSGSQEIEISGVSGSIAPIADSHPSVAPTAPQPASTTQSRTQIWMRGMADMKEANFQAIINGKRPPYSCKDIFGYDYHKKPRRTSW